MKISDLPAVHRTLAHSLQAYRGSLRQLRPARLDADAAAHLERLKDGNEGIMRLVRSPAESARMAAEIRAEYQQARQQAAAVARYRSRQIRAQTAEARAAISRQRQDVNLTFPTALDGVDGNGLITLALLQVQTASALARADAGALLGIYQQALARQDVLGLVQVQAIESMVRSTAYRADGPADLKSAKELRELIASVGDLRLPSQLPDLDQLDADASALDARADLLKVLPLNPAADPAAAAAFEKLQPQLLEAGAASDSDDEQARRQAARQGAA